MDCVACMSWGCQSVQFFPEASPLHDSQGRQPFCLMKPEGVYINALNA